jgi:SAM-dependent methyltransferase
MMIITKLTKEKIYRDSKTWYAEIGQPPFSALHINFCQRHAGKRILDFGCATGGYCLELKRLGFECVGVDINEEYIKIAREKGVEAHLIKDHLPFDDDSFETVIMFELLEHVHDPGTILKEAKRVAKKNILITVPNCENFETLRNYGLTYEHFLELGHISFFTKDSLAELLSNHFDNFEITKGEPIMIEGQPISPTLFAGSGFIGSILVVPLRKLITLLWRIGILKTKTSIFKTKYYACLHALITLDKLSKEIIGNG